MANFVEFSHEEVAQSIPVRFEKIVCRHPQRIAVKSGRNAVTYDFLNRRANHIAQSLLAIRGTAKEPVAVLLEPGWSLLSAFIGILKTGKWYVPIDPSYPPARNSYILDDSQSGVLLTNDQNLSLAREMCRNDVRLINVDRIDTGCSSENPGISVSPGDLSYITYTSGSTGNPKGVMQNHRNLLHKVMVYTTDISISAEDRLALIYAPAASGAARDIYGALLNGACLMPFNIREEELGSLSGLLIGEYVTVCNSSATVFRQLAETLTGRETFPNLRVLSLGSEPVYKSDVELYKKFFPDHCRMIARLGSSEISPIRQFFVDKQTEINGELVPAGYAARDNEVLLLDDEGRPVGPETIGEITVRSNYLSPGYWQRPDLTEAVFLPDPDGGPGRIQRTGDLGLMMPDGCLLYKGRKDFQMKIRGNRVEAAEVETALLRLGLIKEAVVTAWNDGSPEKRLVAYVVSRAQPYPTARDLRRALMERLPDYMVPSSFVFLDALPRTVTGKPDRRSLPEPGRMGPERKSPIIPPRTGTELKLAAIWSEVLGTDEISISDEFVEVGGNSLAAVRVISRVMKELNVTLPLQSLFDLSPLAEIARRIDQSERIEIIPLHPVPQDLPPPLSFGQQRIWLHNQLTPDEPNTIIRAIRINAPLNPDYLKRAIETIVQRHDILRTTYTLADDTPIQVVHNDRAVRIGEVNMTGCPNTERTAAIRRLINDEARSLFDLSKDAMLKTTVLRLHDNDHVLIFTMHHIASDGWSMEIFLRELNDLYIAFSEGKASPLPDLPVQYRHFAYWERHLMADRRMAEHLWYWQTQLASSPPALALPSDRPRPLQRSLNGYRHAVMLPQDLADRLRSISRNEGVTMFTLMMAAFKTLLYRYTGQSDICVGTFVANRNRAEIENLIGFFVNTLVLRTDLGNNPTFLELLQREHIVSVEAFGHQHIPFEKILEALNIKRNPSYTPVFQAALAFHAPSNISSTMFGMDSEPLDSDPAVSLYDLTLIVKDMRQGMNLFFTYRKDIFDAATIIRWADNFLTLLEGIAADPKEHIDTLPLLSDVERTQLTRAWSSAAAGSCGDTCVQQLFESQVKKTPDAGALIFGEEQLTYRKLNNRANQLAHYLRKQGIRPETVVGVCLGRSQEMIVGLLGILKAGGVSLPLDPADPRERLKLMMQDAGVSFLLTQEHLYAGLSLSMVKPVFVDTHWNDIAGESDENPENMTTPSHAAYVLYTSGSTGRPKGVIIEHSSLMHYTLAASTEYGINPSDRVLQFASINFDASIEEIYPSLTTGATLVIRSEELLASSDFIEKWDNWKLTVLSIPTAYWHNLSINLEEEGLQIPSSIRLIIIGGERAQPERLSLWQRHVGPHVKLMNTYGPTEATVVSTVFDLTRFDPGAAPLKELPIGRPLPGVSVYILDHYLQPVPIGAAGELCIGGAGVARGYLKRSELTAEKFIPDPFSQEPRARLYRTGDLARHLPDGNIEFVGRVDHQVKIRGFRIEPDEIEAALRHHPVVQDAIVIARKDQSEEAILVAYIVVRKESSVTISDLRSFLKQKLPDYMVPSFFVELDALPLTLNGKVDRKALPRPDHTLHRQTKTFVRPRNILESKLTKAWVKVLGIQPIGITDNFFELGGHSLLAVRLAAEIRKITRSKFPVMAIFQFPTIEQLAAMLAKEGSSVQFSSLVPIQTVGSRPPFFWVHGQQSDTLVPRYLDAEQPLYGLLHQGQDGKVLYSTVEEIAAHYLEEIRAVRPAGPYLLGGYCFGAMVALEMAQTIVQQGEEVSLLFMLEPPKKCFPLVTLPQASSDNGGAFRSRVSYHTAHLEDMPYGKKIAYALRKLPNAIRLIAHQITRESRNRGRMAICRLYLALGRPLPPALRSFYLTALYHEAIHEYRPEWYPGRVVICHSDNVFYGSPSEVTRLTAGGVEEHIVPGAGHEDIIDEPHVRVWAPYLNQCLDRQHDKTEQ